MYLYFNDEEIKRLHFAQDEHKYSHLRTWKELVYYQLKLGETYQVLQIAEFARRKMGGEEVTLPLKDYQKRDQQILLDTSTTS